MELNFPSKEELKPLLQMKSFLYLPVLTIVLIIVMVMFIMIPNLNSIFELRKEIALAADEQLVLEQKVETLQIFDEQLLDQQVETLEKVLPRKKAVFEWIVMLNSLADETDVILGSYGLSPGSIATESGEAKPSNAESSDVEEPDEGVLDKKITARTKIADDKKAQRVPARLSEAEQFELTVNIEGDFEQIVKYILGLSRVAPLVRVSDLEIARNRRNRVVSEGLEVIENETVGANLVILLFYAPLPEHLPSLTEPVLEIGANEEELYYEIADYVTYESQELTEIPTGRENVFAPF